MREYLRTFKIKENFPIEEGQVFNVTTGLYNRVVESWFVKYVNDKKTFADIVVKEYEGDEYDAVYY